MFTGLIQHVGMVIRTQRAPHGAQVTIDCGHLAGDVSPGDSVAVNGACLTATTIDAPAVTFDAVHETLQRTTVGEMSAGDAVNLELALRAGDRLGGHFVQGHIDGIATLDHVDSAGDNQLWWFAAPDALLDCIVEKGSIALDGVSLTIAAAQGDRFAVAFIPTTLSETTFGTRQPGSRINIEVDIIARVVVHFLHRHNQSAQHSRITMDTLRQAGFVE